MDGVAEFHLALLFTKSYAGIELLINRGSQADNNKIFDLLFCQKEAIENIYGSQLIWERLDNKKSSRIADRISDVDITNRDDWDKIKEFLCQSMIKFEKTLKEPLKKQLILCAGILIS